MHDTTTLLPSGPSEQQARLAMRSYAERGEWTTAEDTSNDTGDRPTGAYGGRALPDAPRRGGGGRASTAAPALPFGEGGQVRDDGADGARVPCGDDPSAPPRAPGRRRAVPCAGGSVPAALIARPLGGPEAIARRAAPGVRERRGRAAVAAASASTTGPVTQWCQSPASRSIGTPPWRTLRPRCIGGDR